MNKLFHFVYVVCWGVDEPCVRYSPVLVPLYHVLSFFMLSHLGEMIVLYGKHLTHPELRLTDPVNSLILLLVSLKPPY